MATRIRLKRLGRKNRPFYRIIVIDSRKRRDGAAIEEVGWYDPILKKEKNFTLDEDRILHWLSQGAQPSDVVKNMMTKTGLSHRWHLMKLGLSSDEIEKNMQKWQLDRELTLKHREEKALEKSALQKKEAEKEKEVGEEVKVAIKSESEDEVSTDESETDTGDSSDTDDGTVGEDSENENIDEESKPKNDFTEQTDDVDLEDEVSKEGSDNADVEAEAEGDTATDSDDSSESKNRKKEKK